MFKNWASRLAPGLAVMAMAVAGSINFAHAQVEANKATKEALETVKGIGPSTSTKILEARSTGGVFKSWPDLAERVKGIGEKTSIKLSDAGLTVNGQSLPNAGVVPSFAAKPADKSAKASAAASFAPAFSAPASPAARSTIPPGQPLFPSSPPLSGRSASAGTAR